jgi:hypothetical protein
MQGMATPAALGTSSALTLRGPAPGGAPNAPSPVAAAPAPRTSGSIDWVIREVEATLGPLPPAADDPGPQEVAPPATGVVATPRRLAAEMLGPLIAPGSHFLELLIAVDAQSFISLRLPDTVRRVIYAPSASSGEVVLVEQSRPELLWPVDIILGAGGNAVLSGRWRAFALGHRLRVGATSSSTSSWGRWRPRCRSSLPSASAAPTPSPRRSKGAALPR